MMHKTDDSNDKKREPKLKLLGRKPKKTVWTKDKGKTNVTPREKAGEANRKSKNY